MVVLSIGRDELPAAQARVTIDSDSWPSLPSPTRLAGVPGIDDNGMARAPSTPTDRIRIPIEIRNLASLRTFEHAGVATFATATGANFQWIPLRDALQQGLATTLVRAEAATGSDLTVTLSPQREHARHGYLARQQLSVQAAAGDSAGKVELDGMVYRVRFQLPTETERAGPFRLQRIEDRQWLPMLAGMSGLTLQQGSETILALGAGTYELQDPLQPGLMQEFTVPATTTVNVESLLAAAKTGSQGAKSQGPKSQGAKSQDAKSQKPGRSQ